VTYWAYQHEFIPTAEPNISFRIMYFTEISKSLFLLIWYFILLDLNSYPTDSHPYILPVTGINEFSPILSLKWPKITTFLGYNSCIVTTSFASQMKKF
jgi:hypothetical protein